MIKMMSSFNSEKTSVKTAGQTLLRVIFIILILNGNLFAVRAQVESQALPQPMKKEIPTITLSNLSPPYLDYDYLKGHRGFPFQAEAVSFNLINAWWLAEISTLVYADDDFVRSRFRRAGLPQVRFFDRQSTQCYVASNDRFAIVAFRGSEIWKKKGKFDLTKVMADLKADVDIRLTDWPSGGKVHRGFRDALAEVWPDLLPYIAQLDRRGCKIWITGHSLGAALATLCGSRYGSVQGVYTFGSPRVGNDGFKEKLDVQIYRVVNSDDIVTRVPPPGVYVHVGELKYIDGDGIIKDRITDSESPESWPTDQTSDQGDATTQTNKSFGGFVPAPFRDHVPLLYAIHLWNNIIDDQR